MHTYYVIYRFAKTIWAAPFRILNKDQSNRFLIPALIIVIVGLGISTIVFVLEKIISTY